MEYGHYIDLEEHSTYLKTYSDENLPLYYDSTTGSEMYIMYKKKQDKKYEIKPREREQEEERNMYVIAYKIADKSVKCLIHTVVTVGIVAFISYL